MGFADLLNTIRKMSKFVLASVHEKVVGGGVGLIAACDYAFATHASSIKLSELSIGLGPYVIEPALSRKIGPTAFAQLSLDSAHWKSAQWGLHKGLYAECVADQKALNLSVNKKAERLADYAPEACRELRKLHWKDTQHWDTLLPENAKITAQLALSDFTQNKNQITLKMDKKVRVTKQFKFETGHALYGYDGLCKNVHGHSYKLDVTVIGQPIADSKHVKNGMVIDFGDLKTIVNQEIVHPFDHATVLNVNSPHKEIADEMESRGHKILRVDYQPTSEMMILDFVVKIEDKLPNHLKLYSLKLQETETAFAEWYADDQKPS